MNLSREELLSQLRGMDEYKFEKLVADIWEQRGWETTVTTGSGDRGMDIIAKKNSPFKQKHVIQAKRYSEGNKVGSPDIQQYSSLQQQEPNVDSVIIVTTSSFSIQAKEIADDLNVKLINGQELSQIITNNDSGSILAGYVKHESLTPNDIDTETALELEFNKSETIEAGDDSKFDLLKLQGIERKHKNIDDGKKRKGVLNYGYCPSCGTDGGKKLLPLFHINPDGEVELYEYTHRSSEYKIKYKKLIFEKEIESEKVVGCKQCGSLWIPNGNIGFNKSFKKIS